MPMLIYIYVRITMFSYLTTTKVSIYLHKLYSGYFFFHIHTPLIEPQFKMPLFRSAICLVCPQEKGKQKKDS